MNYNDLIALLAREDISFSAFFTAAGPAVRRVIDDHVNYPNLQFSAAICSIILAVIRHIHAWRELKEFEGAYRQVKKHAALDDFYDKMKERLAKASKEAKDLARSQFPEDPHLSNVDKDAVAEAEDQSEATAKATTRTNRTR